MSPLRESCRPQEPPTGITSANATLRGIFKVRPIHAFDAQLTSASVIFGASMVGAPVSTTHVVSSALMGIGASERPKAVRWAKAKEIVNALVPPEEQALSLETVDGGVDTVDEAVDDVLAKLKARELIMGFGHAVYRLRDPRNAIIKGWSKQLAELKGDTVLPKCWMFQVASKSCVSDFAGTKFKLWGSSRVARRSNKFRAALSGIRRRRSPSRRGYLFMKRSKS